MTLLSSVWHWQFESIFVLFIASLFQNNLQFFGLRKETSLLNTQPHRGNIYEEKNIYIQIFVFAKTSLQVQCLSKHFFDSYISEEYHSHISSKSTRYGYFFRFTLIGPNKNLVVHIHSEWIVSKNRICLENAKMILTEFCLFE